MDKAMQVAIKYWPSIEPLLEAPKSEKAYEQMIKHLDELLEITGCNENHPLMGMVDIISDHIEAYEAANLPEITCAGKDVLAELIRSNKLRQSDLSHIASQGVISEIINGKRALNLRLINKFAEHFGVPPATFL